MNERGRNILVGLTTLLGLILLGIMIVIFAGLPEMFRPGQKIVMTFDGTYGIESGEPIFLMGKRVGMVADVSFPDGDPTQGAVFTARVDEDIRLPGNLTANIQSKGLLGGAVLTLEPNGAYAVGPDGAPLAFYPPGETIVLEGEYSAGTKMPLPPAVSSAMEEFGKLAAGLNKLIGAPAEMPSTQPTTAPTSRPTTQLAATQPAQDLHGMLFRMNRTLDAMYAVLGDKTNQENFQTSLANIAQASGKFDELTRALIADAEQLNTLLTGLQTSVDSVNQGKGTAGKLLHDPELYANLLRVTQEMEGLMKDFRRLAEQWEKDGVNLKLK